MTRILTILARALPLLLATSARGDAVKVTYDNTYDNASGSLDTVACSDGANGLLGKGYTTFGSLPAFPYIGGAAAVAGWNSPQCGSCWNLTFAGKSVHVLAVDHAGAGFNIAEKAMNDLTSGQAAQLGVVNATAAQVDRSVCGLH